MSHKRLLVVVDAPNQYYPSCRLVQLQSIVDPDGRGTLSLTGGVWQCSEAFAGGSELAAILSGVFAVGEIRPLLDWLIERGMDDRAEGRSQYRANGFVATKVAEMIG